MRTSGDKGHDDSALTRERPIALRREEQRAAAGIFGIQRLTFFDYGEVASAGPRLVEEVTELVLRRKRRRRADVAAFEAAGRAKSTGRLRHNFVLRPVSRAIHRGRRLSSRPGANDIEAAQTSRSER